MFRIIRELNSTVKMANQIATQDTGGKPRWSLFLTNRSFIAQVIATVFALLAMVGVFVPFGAEDIIEVVALVGYLVSQAWALIERTRGNTKVVWNPTQANDALTEALKVAGADAKPPT